jgi:hypothetical protein
MSKWLGAIAIVVAFMAPQAAQAEPTQWADHCYGNPCVKEAIPAGVTEEFGTTGKLTLHVKTAKGKQLLKTVCLTTGTNTFRNEAEHGQGTVPTMTFTCRHATAKTACRGSKPIVKPGLMPWATFLEETNALFADEWHGVSLEVRCGVGTDFGVFTGTLQPRSGEFDDAHSCTDDADGNINFTVARSPLVASSGYTLTVTGILTIEGKRMQPWSVPC